MPSTTIRPRILSRTPSIQVITAPNPGPLTLGGTNTYVVGSSHAYVVDPGPSLQDHLAELVAWLRASSIRIRGVMVTHAHPDHAGGALELAGMLGVPVLASTLSPLLHCGADVLAGGECLPIDDRPAGIRVIETPGHTRDHLVFLVEPSRVLLSGDLVLGRGSTLVAPPDGDMTAYMHSLRRIDELHLDAIGPGHGPMLTNPRAAIRRYIQHRLDREAQILASLSGQPMSIPALTATVYVDLTPALLDAAQSSVEAQLEKLLAEGRVRRDGDLYRLG